MRSTNQRNLNDLRQEIEANIRGYNTPLKSAVKGMSLTELLANCHPMERPLFAKGFYDLHWLNKKTALQYGAKIY